MLISLTACSGSQQTIEIRYIYPSLPELIQYPQRPTIIFKPTPEGILITQGDSLLLRDWLIDEQNWSQAVKETYNTVKEFCENETIKK